MRNRRKWKSNSRKKNRQRKPKHKTRKMRKNGEAKRARGAEGGGEGERRMAAAAAPLGLVVPGKKSQMNSVCQSCVGGCCRHGGPFFRFLLVPFLPVAFQKAFYRRKNFLTCVVKAECSPSEERVDVSPPFP